MSLPAPPQTQPSLEPDRSRWFGQTVREAMVLFVINIVIGAILHVAQLKFFMASEANSSELQKLTGNPLRLLLMVVVVAPIFEELLCRGVPSLLVRGIWKTRNWSVDARSHWYWILGSTSAFLFSVAHGLGDKTMHLPLPQLIMGFVLWHVAMQRGLRYSMLMHATYNLLPGLLILSQATRR
ncbi:MAG TPA: CPBP family intramembrane glutamic endopeptidase [Abditibacteriaceae bacterium]|jgi:membrane protease YdiL (CAAX protease family)|nr:CPBP family intramembrane glutamic endopeptidase [Abditibacteriaceae bacterium]